MNMVITKNNKFIKKGGNLKSEIRTLGPVGFNPTGEYDNIIEGEQIMKEKEISRQEFDDLKNLEAWS